MKEHQENYFTGEKYGWGCRMNIDEDKTKEQLIVESNMPVKASSP